MFWIQVLKTQYHIHDNSWQWLHSWLSQDHFKLVLWLWSTLVWQHVTFLWIINEDVVNIQNKCHNWILRHKICHCGNFELHLTLFDTKVTTCHYLWIINEDVVNIKNIYYNWILYPTISHCSHFELHLTLFDTKVTICHYLWIINEDIVNIKNEYYNWILPPKISHCSNFELHMTLFDTKVTTCPFLWIINEVVVNKRVSGQILIFYAYMKQSGKFRSGLTICTIILLIDPTKLTN